MFKQAVHPTNPTEIITQEISHLRKKKKLQNLLGALLIIIILPFTALVVQNLMSNTEPPLTSSQPTPVTLYFDTASQSNREIFDVRLAAGNNQIAFVRTIINFDPLTTQLVTVLETHPQLSQTITITSVEQANQSGRLELVIALPPEKIATPPTGEIKLATLQFTTSSEITLTYDKADTQIVSLETLELPVNTVPSNL